MQKGDYICEKLGVDAKKVMGAVALDKRINPSHLDPTKGPFYPTINTYLKTLKYVISSSLFTFTLTILFNEISICDETDLEKY
jgi:hypothetical protein